MEASNTLSTADHINNVYPKPLARLHHNLIYDELGFSLIEKRALKEAWRVLEPFGRRLGKDIFYTFLTKYELEINMFRWNNVLQVSRLHMHAKAIMHFMGALINFGLDDPPSFNIMISENGIMHSNVKRETIILLAESIKDYLLNVLQPRSSETLRVAFKKLIDKLIIQRAKSTFQLGNTGNKSQIYGRTKSESTIKIS